MSRPSSGFGHYLRDMVYGALDGVITTMAILAGSQGASLSARIGLILGLANLIGDGISMGASNYLGPALGDRAGGRLGGGGGALAARIGDGGGVHRRRIGPARSPTSSRR